MSEMVINPIVIVDTSSANPQVVSVPPPPVSVGISVMVV